MSNKQHLKTACREWLDIWNILDRQPVRIDETISTLESLVLLVQSKVDARDAEWVKAVEGILDKVSVDCPNCDNSGSYAEHGCNGTEEDCAATCPVQVQCEFCETVPNSKFNVSHLKAEAIKKMKEGKK